MPEVSVLFGKEGTHRGESVQVKIESETNFQCMPNDGRVTPEMVKQISDNLRIGKVCGQVDGQEWHREDA